ncbi:SDR family oxidoreductase [Litoribacter ruber]|uniref:SDR family oxidoreductase n=1 Tax=Litoribacter ruber TaxID=702568 RepID=UPI001BDA3463|nr:SDR family oxidoreductase [Litoribacter ruber]MBT0812219.1 SDR family oxidoreductase [Litoribacter ruber]
MVLNTLTKKVLVTGANGLLGQKLIALLLAQNYVVLATGRGESRLPQDWNCPYSSMEVSDQEAVYDVFDNFKPEVVVHAAAMTQADQCEEDRVGCHLQNVIGTKNIVEACKDHECHLIFLSTDFIFDGKNGPYSENDKPNPANYYGQTKLEGEKLTQMSGLKLWSIVRTVLVYGTMHRGSRSNIILWVKENLEAKKPIKVVSDQWRSPTLVEDLCGGILAIIEKKASGIFNICGPDFLTPYEMACVTADHFQLDKSYMEKVSGDTFTQTAKRPPKTGLILDKAQKELDYRPKSFAEGIGILAKQLKLANS